MEFKDLFVEEGEEYILITPKSSFVDDILEDFKEVIENICLVKNKHVVLDFKNVDILSSRAITNLIRLYKLQNERELSLAIINISNQTENILDAANITKIISIFDTLEEFLLASVTPKSSKNIDTSKMVEIEEIEDITLISFNNSTTEHYKSEDFVLFFSKIKQDKVVFNFKNILNLDEASISAFIELSEKLKGKVVLSNLRSSISDLFELLAINDNFIITETIVDGLNKLKI